MTEYLTLIQRAVDGLAKNTIEARRALYDRARTALVAQLRSVEPALSGAQITKERLALEEAIQKVEAETTRKALAAPRPEQRVAPPLPRPFTPGSPGGAAALRRQRLLPADDSPSPQRASPPRPQEPQRQEQQRQEQQRQEQQRQEQQRQEQQRQEQQRQEPQVAEPGAQAATARSRILGARSTALKLDALKLDALKVLRKVNEVGDRGAAAKGASGASAAPEARRRPPKLEDPAEALDDRPFDELDELEPDRGSQDRRRPPARITTQPEVEPDEEEDEPYDQPLPQHSYGKWAGIAAVLIVVAAVGAAAWQYRDSFPKFYHYVAQLTKPQPANQTAQTTSPRPAKFSGRVPQEGAPDTAASVAGAPGATQTPPQGVVQHAVLLEQDPNDPQGKHFDGTVTWRTDTVSPGPGLAPELEVHGDIVIPERHLNVTLSLRRNTDKALPASHTIQIMFNLPPNFPGEGVSSMPGIFAKPSEQSTGTPLAGISVKVTDNYFLLGLSADSTLQQRNVQLLKDQKWFDIAIVYKNNTKAILAVERGPPGDRAFAEAFTAWAE